MTIDIKFDLRKSNACKTKESTDTDRYSFWEIVSPSGEKKVIGVGKLADKSYPNGSYGKIKPVRDTVTEQQFAMKVMSVTDELPYDTLVNCAKREVAGHLALGRTAQYFANEDQTKVYVLMPWFDGQNIHKKYGNKTQCTAENFKNRLEVIQQTSKQLKSLHDQGLMHFDIKLDNFMEEGSSLVDFNSLRTEDELLTNPDDENRNYSICDITTKDMWMTKAADIYALGLSLANLFPEVFVFSSGFSYAVSLQQNIRIDQKIADKLISLVAGMLGRTELSVEKKHIGQPKVKPEDRLTIDDCLARLDEIVNPQKSNPSESPAASSPELLTGKPERWSPLKMIQRSSHLPSPPATSCNDLADLQPSYYLSRSSSPSADVGSPIPPSEYFLLAGTPAKLTPLSESSSSPSQSSTKKQKKPKWLTLQELGIICDFLNQQTTEFSCLVELYNQNKDSDGSSDTKINLAKPHIKSLKSLFASADFVTYLTDHVTLTTKIGKWFKKPLTSPTAEHKDKYVLSSPEEFKGIKLLPLKETTNNISSISIAGATSVNRISRPRRARPI